MPRGSESFGLLSGQCSQKKQQWNHTGISTSQVQYAICQKQSDKEFTNSKRGQLGTRRRVRWTLGYQTKVDQGPSAVKRIDSSLFDPSEKMMKD